MTIERHVFPAVVLAGMLGVAGLILHEHGAPARLRARAEASGLAATELSIREMG
jgi:hypothetical protein